MRTKVFERQIAACIQLCGVGSGRRRTQLCGCPPSFGLLRDAAALSAPSTCSCRRRACFTSVFEQPFLADEVGVGGEAKSRRSARPQAGAGDIRVATHPGLIGSLSSECGMHAMEAQSIAQINTRREIPVMICACTRARTLQTPLSQTRLSSGRRYCPTRFIRRL